MCGDDDDDDDNNNGHRRSTAAMIAKIIGDDSVSVSPEDADDLLSLRRVIRGGDRVEGSTTRVLKRKQQGDGNEYARPDKGERVWVRMTLAVQRISLDSVLDRLRIGGTILKSNNESVPNGSHHSLILRANDRITLHRSGGWRPAERRLLLSFANSRGRFVLVAIDRAECGIARLRGTRLEFVPNIYSGSGGKRYRTSFNEGAFLEGVRQAVTAACSRGDSVVIFGPGETKRRLANSVARAGGIRPSGRGGASHGGTAAAAVRVVEGIDSGGEDGIYTFTKSQAMREAMSGSKLASVSLIIDEVMALAHRASGRFTMGFVQTSGANRAGAIESLVFSDRAIQDNDEQEVVDLLNDAEKKGARIYGVDSSTDIGLRVTGLGGMVALLRYEAAPQG